MRALQRPQSAATHVLPRCSSRDVGCVNIDEVKKANGSKHNAEEKHVREGRAMLVMMMMKHQSTTRPISAADTAITSTACKCKRGDWEHPPLVGLITGQHYPRPWAGRGTWSASAGGRDKLVADWGAGLVLGYIVTDLLARLARRDAYLQFATLCSSFEGGGLFGSLLLFDTVSSYINTSRASLRALRVKCLHQGV